MIFEFTLFVGIMFYIGVTGVCIESKLNRILKKLENK